MKACICPKYGSPKVLNIQEVEKPTPGDRELLIKVFAATVNRSDLAIITGKPAIMKLYGGFSKPRRSITGCDFAGQVESIGKNVSSFKPGDRVMGFAGLGAQSHAEYLVFPETKAVISIPADMSYEQAACCLEASYYAITCILQLKPKPGQKAMVYGATGGIGSAMVQYLKHFGLSVTAVCGTENIELVKSLGPDRIIDYQKQDFTKDPEKYDFVFDAVGYASFSQCKPLLNKKGIYAPTDKLINFLLTLTTKIGGGKRVFFSIPKDLKGGLIFIRDLAEQKKFKPLLDRIYPFDQVIEAFEYVATKQKLGNVVVRMSN